jgi:hypothetical protein
LIGLVLLYYFARKYHGISTQISSNHYYWTYGPTTILMVVVALWRQVDYTCRRITPWEELDNQQIKTQKSLLLDYVSPFLLNSLLRAIRYQHWSVVLSLVGFMLLKLITIFSTGLLVLSSTLMSDQGIQLQTSSIISAEYYCNYSSITCNYSSPSIDAYMEFLGILNDRLPYPSGTTSTSVFESIDLSKSIPEGAIITSTVPGFYPVFDCQVATVHDNAGFPTRDNFTFYGSTVSANPFNVSIGDQTWRVDGTGLLYCNPAVTTCSPRSVSTFDLSDIWAYPAQVPWLLAVTDVRYNQTVSRTLNESQLPENEIGTINITEWSARLEQVTAVLCTMNYSIEDTKLRIDTAQRGSDHFMVAEGPLSHSGAHLGRYTDRDLSSDYVELLMEVIPSAFPETSEYGPNIFDLISNLHAVEDSSSYLKPEVLMNVSARTFSMLAAQIASGSLRTSGKRNVTGSMEYFEDRLHVKSLSFWVMAIGLVVMLGITLSILKVGPRASLTQDPSSLASWACILASQSDLNQRLLNTGSMSNKALISKLSSLMSERAGDAYEHLRNPLGASLSDEDDPKELKRRQNITSHGRWQPLAAYTAFKVFSLVALCATITILAVLQRVSDIHNGIANVESSSTVAHSLSTYIPAAFMLLLATLCSSAYFAIILMSPYHYLSNQDANTQRTVLLDIGGTSSIAVIYKSLRRILMAPALISSASILSGFLTIVVSGLYTTMSVPLPRSVSVNQLDHFNTAWDSSATDNNAMTILNLLEHSNGTFPSFTYGELAMPAIEIAQNQDTISRALTHNNDLSLSVSMPVTRGSLSCTLISKDDFRVVENPYQANTDCQELSCGLGTAGTVPNTTFDVSARSASYCNLPGHFDEKSTVNYYLQLQYPINDYNGGIVSVPGCPSLAFSFGYFSSNSSLNYSNQDTTNKDNVTTFVCSQYLEESVANVHFLLPSLSIDASRPPVFNASNSRVVSTTQFDITTHLSQLSSYPFYSTGRPSDYSGQGGPALDTFTQIILFGTRGIPVQELMHPSNADRLIEAVQHIYRLYMAQAISANMRQNFSAAADASHSRSRMVARDGTGPIPLTATFLDPTRMRVVQNRPSAIVLEVLLVLILVLTVAAYGTTRLSGILPHNPCSIAGVMSLFAGSRLCDRKAGLLPDGAELWTEKEREEEFERWSFHLGWWGGDGDGEDWQRGEEGAMRFGIDVELEKELEEKDEGLEPPVARDWLGVVLPTDAGYGGYHIQSQTGPLIIHKPNSADT